MIDRRQQFDSNENGREASPLLSFVRSPSSALLVASLLVKGAWVFRLLVLLLFFRSPNNEPRAHREDEDDGPQPPRRRDFPRAVEEYGERAVPPTDIFKRPSVQIVRAGPPSEKQYHVT
jgi:hypothetical protein